MTQSKIVLVEDGQLFTKLDKTLKEAQFGIVKCKGGFEALKEIGLRGADVVVALTSLFDLNGYQLSCLIKSNESTARLPVVLVKNESANHDQFWQMVALPDVIIDSKQLSKEDVKLVDMIKDLIQKAQDKGWKANEAENLLVPFSNCFLDNKPANHSALLDYLLLERLARQLTYKLAPLVGSRKDFIDAYFNSVYSLVKIDILGLIVVGSQAHWASFQLTPGLKKDAFDKFIATIGKQLKLSEDIFLDIRGDFSNKIKAIGEVEVLSICSDDSGSAALVFGSYQKKTFSAEEKTLIAQLKLHMQPIVQLLLAKQEIEQLHTHEAHRSSTDALTGLYNLEFLVGFLQQQLLFSFRQHLPVGMIIIDIDDFANINEKHGYKTGDVVITSIANRLLSITRSSDLAARYGSDEFAIVLPNTDLRGTQVLADKIRLEIQQINFARDAQQKELHATVSVGCSTFNMEDLNPETILLDAKLALKRAKEAGKNRISA